MLPAVISIEDVDIPSGECRIGVSSDGNADNWVKVNDISLVMKKSTGISSGPLRTVQNLRSDYMHIHGNKILALPGTGCGTPRKLSIYDLNGKHLQKIVTSENKVDLKKHGLGAGSYIVKIQEDMRK